MRPPLDATSVERCPPFFTKRPDRYVPDPASDADVQPARRASPLGDFDLDDAGQPAACPNCGTERQGPYCHQCGQRFLRARLSAQELLRIFASRFLDWEQGLWPTFVEMTYQPGTVIARYLDGQRRRYLNPFSYLTLCALLYAVVQALLRQAGAAAEASAVEAQGLTADLTAFVGAVDNEYEVLALVIVGGVGLVAPVLKLMFDRRLLNGTEATVVALFASGSVLLYAAPVTVGWALLTGNPLPDVGLGLTFGALFPLCMAQAGYGLFGSFGMAGYTGFAPVLGAMAGALGGSVTLGIFSSLVEMYSWDKGTFFLSIGILVACFLVPIGAVYLIYRYA
jgi:hypothetical protein